MTTTPGIAGSHAPEVEGVFVCPDTFDVDFFLRMNNTGGPVDVWAIDDVEECHLVESDSGFSYLPDRISAERLTLLRQDLPARARDDGDRDRHAGAAYRSTLTVTLDDGTVLRDDAARTHITPPLH